MKQQNTSMLLRPICPPAENQVEEMLAEIYRRIESPEAYSAVENLMLLYMYVTERHKWVMWQSADPRRAGIALAREIEALTYRLMGEAFR